MSILFSLHCEKKLVLAHLPHYHSCVGPTETDSNVIHSEDIATTIKRRADCMSNEHQYAMNADENMVTLAKELNIETATNRLSLMRLWSWIARAEQLCESSSDGKTIGSTAWPTNGNLTNVGVWTLLGMDQGDDDNGGNKNPNFADTRTISPALSCEVYDSPARRYVNCLCYPPPWTTRIIFFFSRMSAVVVLHCASVVGEARRRCFMSLRSVKIAASTLEQLLWLCGTETLWRR